MQQFNHNIISDSTFILNYLDGINEEETKEVLTQFSDEQLQQAKKLLKKEYRSIFLSPFTFKWFWILFACVPLLPSTVKFAPEMLVSIYADDLIMMMTSVLGTFAVVFLIFMGLMNFSIAKMRLDIEAINQLLKESRSRFKLIENEQFSRKYQYWKVKYNVKNQLTDYME